jgi:hypothetical protein
MVCLVSNNKEYRAAQYKSIETGRAAGTRRFSLLSQA